LIALTGLMFTATAQSAWINSADIVITSGHSLTNPNSPRQTNVTLFLGEDAARAFNAGRQISVTISALPAHAHLYVQSSQTITFRQTIGSRYLPGMNVVFNFRDQTVARRLEAEGGVSASNFAVTGVRIQ